MPGFEVESCSHFLGVLMLRNLERCMAHCCCFFWCCCYFQAQVKSLSQSVQICSLQTISFRTVVKLTPWYMLQRRFQTDPTLPAFFVFVWEDAVFVYKK